MSQRTGFSRDPLVRRHPSYWTRNRPCMRSSQTEYDSSVDGHLCPARGVACVDQGERSCQVLRASRHLPTPCESIVASLGVPVGTSGDREWETLCARSGLASVLRRQGQVISDRSLSHRFQASGSSPKNGRTNDDCWSVRRPILALEDVGTAREPIEMAYLQFVHTVPHGQTRKLSHPNCVWAVSCSAAQALPKILFSPFSSIRETP